jgi:collagenase-like PrtC family protease
MRILAPFDAFEEVPALIEAGADELYCGVLSEEWKGRGVSPNARPMDYGNLKDFAELRRALELCRQRSVAVFLCLNEYVPCGCEEQLARDIDEAIACGVDGLIVTDMNWIGRIKERSRACKVVLSSLAPCFNARSLEFFKELSVDRIVLPSGQLSCGEIGRLNEAARHMGLELEVFVKNTVCRNIPGFCLQSQLGFQESPGRRLRRFAAKTPLGFLALLPRGIRDSLRRRAFVAPSNPRPCRQDVTLDIWERRAGSWSKTQERMLQRLDRAFVEDLCQACSLFDLWEAGVACGKIVGRGCPTSRKVADVRFVKACLDRFSRGEGGRAVFLNIGREAFREVYGRPCDGKKCFYENAFIR